MSSRKPIKTFLDHIKAEEDILLSLENQFATLKCFEEELVKRIGSRTFIIANSVVWDAMLAKLDLFTIRFASWVRGMVEPGGFFGQVQSHHIRDLRSAWRAQPRIDDEIQSLHISNRRQHLEILFPAATVRGQIDPKDVDDLKNAMWNKLQPIVKDRDSLRAHPYDGEAKADAKMLGLGEVEPLLRYAQDLMNTFRLAANNSSFGYHVTTHTDLRTATRDLIDLLLFHGIGQLIIAAGINKVIYQATNEHWWQLRDAFLSELSQLGTKHPELPLNDSALIKAATRAVLSSSK